MTAAPGDGPAGSLPLRVRVRGDGEPVLLLHGLGGHAFSFRFWIDELARGRQVFLIDLKGFGSAPKPRDRHYSMVDEAALIQRLILERDLRRVTLIGHSWGGGVALIEALALLDEGEGRLARLISVSGVAYPQELPPYVAKARPRWLGRALLRLWPKRHLIGSALKRIVHDPDAVTEEQVEAYAQPLRTSDGRAALLEAAIQIIPPEADRIVARYGEIAVPALLLWGRNDPVVPPWVGERLQRDLPTARLVTLDRCGHMLPEERPRESLDAVLAFLDST